MPQFDCANDLMNMSSCNNDGKSMEALENTLTLLAKCAEDYPSDQRLGDLIDEVTNWTGF